MNRTSPRLAARSALALTLAAIAPLAAAQLPPGDGPASVTVNVTEPSPTRLDEAMVQQLKVPSGFRISPPSALTQPGPADPAAEQAKARRPAQFGRLAGLAVAADGALLVAEDQNGVIYRISHSGL